MAVSVIMPRQGQSVESCIIAKWFKKKGDSVNPGDLLFSYETDKAAFDEESKVSGTILEIYALEGDDVPVLTNVCVIGTPGEDTSPFTPKQDGISEKKADIIEEKSPVPSPAVPVQIYSEQADHPGISPRARKTAEKNGVDFRFSEGTGPHGRIIENDILSLKEKGHLVTSAAMDFLGASPISGTGLGGRITTKDLTAPFQESAKPEYEEIKLSNIRKVIAKAMFNSISTTCQLTLNSSFDATDVMEFRKKIKDSKERLNLENITLNDIIAYSVSRTLMNHKNLNAHYLDDKMLCYRNVHLGIAVDTERGLMVPTLFNANLKSLNQISAEIKSLVQDCQKGTINPDNLKGGTFTITNLGTLDIESFTPVLNPPQTGILGVNNILSRVKEANGEYKNYPAMGLSLTFDHRALDGAPAAKFLKDLKNNLESFSMLLVK